jgi:hypothetical protein
LIDKHHLISSGTKPHIMLRNLRYRNLVNLAAKLVPGASQTGSQCLAGFNSTRGFASSFQEEYKKFPWKNTYMVQIDPAYEGEDDEMGDEMIDPENDFKIPYILDIQQQMMFCMHMYDPSFWTIEKISAHFHCSAARTKSIIVLMHQRFEMMKERGVIIKIYPPDPDEYQDFLQTIKRSKVIDDEDKEIEIEKFKKNFAPIPDMSFGFPEEWDGLYDLLTKTRPEPGLDEDNEPEQQQRPPFTVEDVTKIIEEYNGAEGLAEEKKTKLSAEQLHAIFVNMDDHYRRMDNVIEYENMLFEMLDDLDGRYPKHHQETSTDYRMKGTKKSIKETYFPRLLRGEDYEKEKEKLIHRIEAETRARVDYTNFEHFSKKFDNPATTNPELAAVNERLQKNKEAFEKPSRWKIAFRDLTKNIGIGKDQESTTIISRTGK